MTRLKPSQRAQIDRLWLELVAGGLSNPILVAEQLSWVVLGLSVAASDDTALHHELRRCASGPTSMASLLPGLVRDRVLPLVNQKWVAQAGLRRGFVQAIELAIPTDDLLELTTRTLLGLAEPEADHAGDILEYVVSKLGTSGILGQFRTPQHILELMVRLVNPTADDVVLDPACGTGGFLYTCLDIATRQHAKAPDIIGFESDELVGRLAWANLYLRGVAEPKIERVNSLSASCFSAEHPWVGQGVDVILANPPFKGVVNPDLIDTQLSQTLKSSRIELYFLVAMMRWLKPQGRCAVVVPSSVLFSASKAHRAVRNKLVREMNLEAVLSLPRGVFRPYAAVSTAILLFRKAPPGEHVFFYDVQADGFSLDDRRVPVESNDLPDVIEKFHSRSVEKLSNRVNRCFMVSRQEIEHQAFDLSFNQYHVSSQVDSSPSEAPELILSRLEATQNEISEGLRSLRSRLS